MDVRTIDWSVYVITGRPSAHGRSVIDVVRATIRGGAGVVQLRAKTGSPRQVLTLGRALLAVTRAAGLPLIVNDRVDLALALGADGAHVGQDDLPVAAARRLLGPDRLLGVSVRTVAEAEAAVRAGADHLGAGDVYGTRSKDDAGVPIGASRLAAVARSVSVPVLAIGGITAQNAEDVARAGAAGVAVISAVFHAEDPEAATRALHARVQAGHGVPSSPTSTPHSS